MPILIILGWLIVLGCFFYLAADAGRNRMHERREKKAAAKKIQEFKKHHHYDEKRGKWVRNRDGVALPDASADFRRSITPFGYLMLVFWEIFWVAEIAATPRLSQIPFFFLLIMMVGIPLAVRMLSRGILWPSGPRSLAKEQR
jgi:Flp pilus assembly protein TadB